MLWPWLAATLAAAAFFAVAWLRFASYHSTAYDLAFFDQAVWNAARGTGLHSSFVSYPFLGQHFEPALYLFVPLYRLHATPLWLLGAQSLALGAAVVPLWALARRWLGSGSVGPAIACTAYLLQVGVARAVGFDFHTEALAVPFVFLALLGAARDDMRLLLLAGAVPMLCKEDGALVTLGIALLALLVVRRRRATLALAGFALAGGALVVLVAMPHLRGGLPGDLVARYAYLGNTPGAVLLHLVTEPGVWLRHVAGAPAGPALLMALAAVGFLPLLRPLALLACVPALLLPLLADDAYQGGLRLHYALQATPLLVCAAMLGWRRSRAWLRGVARSSPAAATLAGSLATWLALSPLPGGHGPDAVDLSGVARGARIDVLLARIPAGASVAATGDLLTHLAERRSIAELPALQPPDWVAVDTRAAPSQQSRAAGYAAAVASLPSRGYVRVAGAAGVVLWRRGGSP